MGEKNPNYWVVGASFDGEKRDLYFVENSYWYLGWTKDKQPAQFKKGEQIKINDRIAIKTNKIKKGQIKILHIGIVKGVIMETNKIICVVDWVATNLNRSVESKGCSKSIHQFTKKDEWIEKVFCL